MKNILIIITLLLIVLLNTACQKKDHQTFIIESDGDLSYQVLEDINRTREYLNTDNIVDNNVYNFSIIFPIKAKKNVQKILEPASMFFHTTDKRREQLPNRGFDNFHIGNDGYYHYEIRYYANSLASKYFLNDIRDIEISYLYEEKNYTDDIKYDTNKLIIPKEQLINLLDSLAIPHDRLDFQTD